MPLALRRVAAVLLRQYYLIRGSFTRLVPQFVWIVIDMVLWGFITRYLNAVSGSGLDFVPRLLGAALLWDFFTRVMQGVTMTFFEDVWARNFLNIFATPMNVSEYVAGLVLSSIATSALGLAIMLAFATIAFGLSFASYGIALVPFLLVLFIFGIALGIIGCGLVLRFGPAAEWFVWPIPAAISPFAGVFYPLSTLPRWMHPISLALPPAYVFEGMRTIVAGGAAPLGRLGLASALAVAYVALASWLFTRIYRHAVRTGLIARYSAETIS